MASFLAKQLTVILFLSINNAKFGICTVVNLHSSVPNAHCTNISSTKCPTYSHDGANDKFSTNWDETYDSEAFWWRKHGVGRKMFVIRTNEESWVNISSAPSNIKPLFFPSTLSLTMSTGPVVLKEMIELLLYDPLLKREGTYVYTKQGTRVPSLNTGV